MTIVFPQRLEEEQSIIHAADMGYQRGIITMPPPTPPPTPLPLLHKKYHTALKSVWVFFFLGFLFLFNPPPFGLAFS